MKKRAEYLDDAALTFARQGALGDLSEKKVKEGIIAKTAFVQQTVYNVINKTAELVEGFEVPDAETCQKLAKLVNDEISVTDTLALDRNDFTDLVLHKTSQLALELDQEISTKK